MLKFIALQLMSYFNSINLSETQINLICFIKCKKITQILLCMNAMHTSVASILRPLILGYYIHPHDLVRCCSIRRNLTDWAQSIFLSQGWTNLALEAYASTYSIGNPRDTFLVNLIMVKMVDAIKASSGSSD
jgi:hypothetical protein